MDDDVVSPTVDEPEKTLVLGQEEPPAAAQAAPAASTTLISDETWASATAAWIDAHVRNSPLAQVTDAWNHLHAALPSLRQHLEIELGRNVGQ